MVKYTIEMHTGRRWDSEALWVIRDEKGHYVEDPKDGTIIIEKLLSECTRRILEMDCVTHVGVENSVFPVTQLKALYSKKESDNAV